MMNNYFHNVAIALLVTSDFALHASVRVQSVMDSQIATLFFLKTHALSGLKLTRRNDLT